MDSIALKEISNNIFSGLTPLRSNKDFWEDGSVPWLKTEQLGEKDIYDTTEKISLKALEGTSIKLCPINTLSVAMYGEGRTRGSVSIIKKEMTTNQACCNISIDEEKADYEFIYYYLKTQYHQLRNLSSGVRKNLNSNDIKNFEIRLPKELKTQKKIASTLSTIDKKIELNNQINQKLESMAKTLYDYWFVQFDFPDVDGKPYKSSGGKMVYSEELKRGIPEGWKSGKLENMALIIGGSTPSKAKSDNFSTVGTPWITPKDLSLNVGNKFITKGAIDVSDKGLKESSLRKLSKGTILLSTRAPIGYMAIARDEMTTNQGFKSFVPKDNYSTEYIFYTIKSVMKLIEKNASGSTFKEISSSVLKSLEISLAPMELINRYTNKVKPIFERQDLLEIENQKLTQLRDWLLPMLMNGQVGVK